MDIYAQAQLFRRQLLQQDDAALNRLALAYRPIYANLKAQFDTLTQLIQAAEAQEQTVSRAWLLRQERFGALLNQIAVQIERYGLQAVLPATEQQQRQLATLATEHAAQLISTQRPEVALSASFNRLPVAAIEQFVGQAGDGTPLGKLLRGYGTDVAHQVRDAMLSGMAGGQGIQKMAGEVVGILDRPRWEAARLVRTESLRAYRESSRQTYEQHGVTQWQWLASKSRNTCAACLFLDGQVFKVEKPMPSHINCRCTLIPLIEGVELPKREVGAEWFARQSTEVQADVLGIEGAQAYKEGKVALSDFVGITRSKAWGESRYQIGLTEARKNAATVKPVKPAKVVALKPVKVPALPQPGNFKKVAEAEAWAKEAYPHLRVNFKGCHVDALNPTLMQFEKLAREYPEVVKRMQFITTYRGENRGNRFKGSFAHAYSETGAGIGLNPAFYGKPKNLLTDLERCVEKGWLQKGGGSIESVFTHEFGHLVDGWLRKGGATPAQIKDTVLQWQRTNKANADLSRYATTKTVEAWAEGFAALHHLPEKEWPQFVRNQVELLAQVKSMLKRLGADQ